MRTTDAMKPPTVSPAFRWSVESCGLALACRPLGEVAQHLFTTRQLTLRPAAELATENLLAAQREAWSAATASVGGVVGQLLRVRQVHGRTVRVIDKGDVDGHAFEARPQADALVSNEPGVVLAVQVADCVPVLIADRKTGAAGAVHAGWRGTAARIAEEAIAAMVSRFATSPSDLTVAVGPSIGPCCYQVGNEVRDTFRQWGAREDELSSWFQEAPDGSLRLDLWAATRDQLRATGVPAHQIHVAALCTATHIDIFNSYRVEGAGAGRMAALIRVPGGG